jgi:hypothetical protein
MPVTGKFLSDFSDFDRGAKNAQVTLDNFQKAADKAGGRLMDLGGYSDKSGGKILQFTNQFREFDSLMSAAGVNIGPIGRAISELGVAASSSAESLGVLGTAGVAVGGTLATYNFARWALEFTGAATGLDTAIQNLVQHMLGFKTGAAEAGAKADVLALASKNAGRDITDFNEAVQINRKAADDLALAWGRSVNPMRDTREELSRWQREIRELRKRGDYEALTADLDLQAKSVQELSVKYGIHTDALEYLKRKIAETAAAEDKAATASAAANARRVADMEATAKVEEEFRQTRWKQQLDLDTKLIASTQAQSAAYLDLTNNAVLKELEAHLANTKGVEAEETAFTRLTAAQQALQTTKIAGFSTQAQETKLMNDFGQALMDAAIKEEKARFAAQGVNEEAAKMPETTAPAAAGVQQLGSSAQQAAGSFFQMSAELYNAIRAAQQFDDLARKDPNIYGSTIGGIAGSSPTSRYMGAASSGVTVNIHGSVLSNSNEIARAVGDAVTSSYRTGGNRLPV